jgi:uncharacterized protein (UPF0262 family)
MNVREQAAPTHKVIDIVLDEANIVRLNADIDHERRVAIFDLLEDNFFKPVGSPHGPYRLHLLIVDNRLVFDVRREDDSALGKVMLALSPFRRIVKDYFAICDSYFDAIKHAPPSQIEAIDMGRRGLHNDGAELLRERLAGKIEIDTNTSRRLFTLICVLHIRA